MTSPCRRYIPKADINPVYERPNNKGALGALVVYRTARILQHIQSINIY